VPVIIPDHVLEQVRHANDVVDVIGSYFPLKRAGANFRALCPFHKEKTPSFNVNPSRQIWHCFGCGAGGDVFSFVMKYESLDFMAAVRRLAERAGIEIEMAEAKGGPSRNERDELFRLHEQVSAFFHNNLMKEPSAQVARDYLTKRKITSETAKKWRIGYSPDSWDALTQWAKTKNFSPALLATAGLVLPRDTGGVYDRFRGRLMFSICDEQGRVVGFSGRILTDAKDQPKYVNSPETPIFQKGKILFALDKAKRAILDEKLAIICEGQVDTISCHEAGLANVVAPQGTALTEQHARILKRYAEEVVLMFDADTAGQNAAVRGAEALWDAGMAIRVVVLPEGHDPDSFVKTFGAEKLKTMVTSAPTFFVFLLERLTRLHDPRSDRGKLQIAHQVAEWLVRIPTPILLATYAQQTAKRLNISEDVLRKEISKLTKRGRSPAPEPQGEEIEGTDPESERPKSLPAEEMLLQAMLADERIVDSVVERIDPIWLTGSLAGDLIRQVLKMYDEGRWTGSQALLHERQTEEGARLVSELLLRSHKEETLVGAMADCLNSLEKRCLEQKLNEVKQQLGATDLSPAEMIKLQQQGLDLRRKLDNIHALLMRKPIAPQR
jgi:DNA primase